MKANEIRTIAATIAANAKSSNEIKGMYKEFAEKYGKEDARAIVDKAREIRAANVEKVMENRNNAIISIDTKALEWEFDGLKKDKDFKALCFRAMCKCADVSELVAKWYPHTIDRVPARIVEHEDGRRTWEKKEKINASSTLKACLRQIAKMAKGAKAGTTTHTAGEEAPAKKQSK